MFIQPVTTMRVRGLVALAGWLLVNLRRFLQLPDRPSLGKTKLSALERQCSVV